ncbi:hypothetical protein [Saccharopolyspora hattusasensis]|uniref:hypothetical protein n=1 Tax=Saccharopolyspora hattusasensis TaxID=1128679 RepID=UPI003D95E619
MIVEITAARCAGVNRATFAANSAPVIVGLASRSGASLIWHCYREQATTLQIETSEGETRLAATFESEDLKGQLNVRVYPPVAIHDSTLRG